MSNAHHCFRDDHELYREVLRARAAAHAKHGDDSIERVAAGDVGRWLPILVEEGGEIGDELFAAALLAVLGRIGRTQTYDQDPGKLRGELIDLLAVASAWVDAIDRPGRIAEHERVVALRAAQSVPCPGMPEHRIGSHDPGGFSYGVPIDHGDAELAEALRNDVAGMRAVGQVPAWWSDAYKLTEPAPPAVTRPAETPEQLRSILLDPRPPAIPDVPPHPFEPAWENAQSCGRKWLPGFGSFPCGRTADAPVHDVDVDAFNRWHEPQCPTCGVSDRDRRRQVHHDGGQVGPCRDGWHRAEFSA